EKRLLTPVETYDPNSELFQVEDALEMSCELLSAAKDHDPRVLVDYGAFTAIIGSQAICSSEGIEAKEKSSAFVWQLLGMAREGDEVGSYAASFDATTRVRDINVQNTATDFAKKAIDSLGAKSIESFSGSLILTPLAAIGFIVGPLVSSTLADNLQKGRSLFAGRIGTQVVSECVDLEDDGTIPRAIGSGMFDREGSPHAPMKIINAGQFISPLYNSLAANREEKETSGHAVGSYRSVPMIGPTNLLLRGTGDKLQKADQLISNTKRGIIVNRFSGDVDSVSGYFSGLIKGGFHVANGEIVHPVTSITIQGNIFETLNRIGGITHETKHVGSWILPELIEFEDIQFTSQ
ncbi:MAG: TldD/PmbA family protein, partial [Candidatus Hodarchaeota archaeon]